MTHGIGLTVRASAAALCLLAGAGTALATPEGAGDADPLDEMRRRMDAMERRHAAEMAELRTQLAQATSRGTPSLLEEEVDALVERLEEVEASVSARRKPDRGRSYINVSVNGLVTAGGANVGDEVIQLLQGGGHDPKKRGFTLQQVELSLSGAVDPYFNGQVYLIALIDPEGETIVELEEAFATTTSLPYGLQVKAGQFYTEFGRHNPTHPHAWEFVDQPFTLTRFFGPDGMRGPGARVSWLAPVDFPLEASLGVQNANGETMTSFLGVDEDEEGHGHGGEAESRLGEFVEREVRSLDDLVWSGRVSSAFDIDDEWTTLLGASAAWGPNSGGVDTDTKIFGVDLTAKWKPVENDQGFPFVAVTAEYLRRDFEFDAFADEDGDFFPAATLDDDGLYAQVVWGFMRNWTAGVRYETYGSDVRDPGFGLDDRDRWALALTHYFSEYSKLRLQFTRDESDAIGKAMNAVWLQFEFNIGSHAAHEF